MIVSIAVKVNFALAIVSFTIKVNFAAVKYSEINSKKADARLDYTEIEYAYFPDNACLFHMISFSDFLFKFLVIGSAGTGKSCLLHQFIEGKCKYILLFLYNHCSVVFK